MPFPRCRAGYGDATRRPANTGGVVSRGATVENAPRWRVGVRPLASTWAIVYVSLR
jgi:hypothetical protein